MAEALKNKEPDCTLIFPDNEEKWIVGDNVIHLNFDLNLLQRLRGKGDGLSLFAMGPEPWENYRYALEGAEAGINSYCMADLSIDHMPAELRLFSPNEVMSRYYWKEHPLNKQEKTVILIGCGSAGCALLERALLTNVFEKGRLTNYHVFGDTRMFEGMHPEIVKALGKTESGDDTLCFHRESWIEARPLLEKADRILVCGDNDSENHNVCDLLGKWFVTTGSVHALLREPIPGLESFGSLNECFTPEYVMKDEVNRQAILLNDIYNEGAEHPTAWQDLSAFLKQSNVAAADHLIIKARYLLDDESIKMLTNQVCQDAYAQVMKIKEKQADILQEFEHRRWLRFHQLYNWQYAPVRDNSLRRHTQMLPYEKLDAENKKKDLYAWEMFGHLKL